jgi:hypothetical protein
MPLVFQMDTPQQRSWYVLQLAKEGIYNSSATFTSHTILHGTTTEFLQHVFEWLW